jgi:uncharacterized membrane protein
LFCIDRQWSRWTTDRIDPWNVCAIPRCFLVPLFGTSLASSRIKTAGPFRFLSDRNAKGANQMTNEKNASVVAVFDSHERAEQAVKDLQRTGFNMKQLSIVGKDYHSEEHVVGFYRTSDRMLYWGGLGAFWGGLWGVLFGAAFFWVPGIGPLVVAGPLVSAIVGGLEGMALLGGLSALGAGLISLGIPKESVLKYELAVKANQFLLIAHGSPAEVGRAKEIVELAAAVETEIHHRAAATATA